MIEIFGILIIASSIVYATIYAIWGLFRRSPKEVYAKCRQQIGKGILLGLELLVAADIILTVAVELTFESVGVLAIIVLIRTFLSFTLNAEIEGKWPWQDSSAEQEV